MPRPGPALLAFFLLLPASVLAASNPNAKVLIHLAPPVAKVGCSAPQAKPPCSGVETAGDLLPATYFAYVLGTDAFACRGISALDFGVSYNNTAHSGVDVYSWTACAPVSFATGSWPAAGSGLIVQWDPAGACQTSEPGGPSSGVTATAGYFYVAAYSADELRITTHPTSGQVRITDCGGVSTVLYGAGIVPSPNPSPLGFAAFSAGASAPGYDPCGANLAPPSCVILGPPSMKIGATYTYGVDASSCDGAATWSISGDGSIQGATTGMQVQVHADAVGSFELTASGNAPDGPFVCSRTVEVTPPAPPCSITGPNTVSPGVEVPYTAVDVPGATYDWSISGDGSIVSGQSARIVTIAGTAPGSLHLDVTITLNGVPSTCGRDVTVNYGGCTIFGFEETFPAPAVYTFAGGLDPSAAFLWSITGNGAILGSTTGWKVDVQAGPAAAGPFTLEVRITKSSSISICTKEIPVLDPPPPPPGGNAQAKIMLHVVPNPPVGCDLGNCCTFGATRPCSTLVTKGGLYPPNLYYAALLVIDGETDGSTYSGISGVQCGIDYNGSSNQGIDVFGWTMCAYLEFPSGGWPNAGSGNRVLFDAAHCQKREPAGAGSGVSAQFGYFYIGAYSADRMSITTRPIDGLARVIDCAGRETTVEGGTVHGSPSPLGHASFSAGAVEPGYNPCNLVIPVENTTWSRIKARFREPAKPENSDQR